MQGKVNDRCVYCLHERVMSLATQCGSNQLYNQDCGQLLPLGEGAGGGQWNEVRQPSDP